MIASARQLRRDWVKVKGIYISFFFAQKSFKSAITQLDASCETSSSRDLCYVLRLPPVVAVRPIFLHYAAASAVLIVSCLLKWLVRTLMR